MVSLLCRLRGIAVYDVGMLAAALCAHAITMSGLWWFVCISGASHFGIVLPDTTPSLSGSDVSALSSVSSSLDPWCPLCIAFRMSATAALCLQLYAVFMFSCVHPPSVWLTFPTCGGSPSLQHKVHVGNCCILYRHLICGVSSVFALHCSTRFLES